MKQSKFNWTRMGWKPALVIFCAILTSCSSKGKSDSTEIRVGLYASLTGSTASFGQANRKGVELAVSEINDSGGVLGKKIRLITEDTQGRPEEAQTVVAKLITRDRVVAVIGESGSSRSLAAAPLCQQHRIPMITPTSTNPRVTQMGDYIFRVCFIDSFQGTVLAKFIAGSLKLKKVAILRDVKTDYSVGLAEAFSKHFKTLGGEIIADESYSEGDTDFSAQLTNIRSTDPEVVLLPGYYTEVGLIARQARKLGITVPLVGGDGWDSSKIWSIGGEALNGCYYSNHYSQEDPNPVIQDFIRKFRVRYNEVPESGAVLGYDAVKFLQHAFETVGDTDPVKVRDALAATKEFQLVSGKITIDENRDPIKPVVIVRFQDGNLKYVETIQP